MRRLLVCILLLCSVAAFAQNTVLLPVKQHGRWGYADTTGKTVIAPQFEAASYFENRMAVVMLDRKSYIINTAGEKMMAADFDQIIILGDSLVGYSKNENWGVMSLSGKSCLSAEYDEVQKTGFGVIAFRRDSLWGYLTAGGSMICDAKYDTAYFYSSQFMQGFNGETFSFFRMDNGKCLFEDSCSKIFPCPGGFIARRGKYWGSAAEDGQPELAFIFDTIHYISRNFAEVVLHGKTELWSPKKNTPLETSGKYKSFAFARTDMVKAISKTKQVALIDTSGREIFPPVYDDIIDLDGSAWFVIQNKRWGMARSTGEVFVAPKYALISSFRSGVAVVQTESGFTGAINISGKQIVQPANQKIFVRNNTVKITRPDLSATFVEVDDKGNVREKTDYANLRTITVTGREGKDLKKGQRIVSTNRKSSNDSLCWFYQPYVSRWGLRNSFTSDTLIPAVFVSINRYQDKGYTLVAKSDVSPGPVIDGKTTTSSLLYGLVDDSTGKFLMKPQYVFIDKSDLGQEHFRKMVRAMRSDGVNGLVATDGSERIMAFSFVGEMVEGRAAVCVGGKYTSQAGRTKIAIGIMNDWNIRYNLIRDETPGSLNNSYAQSRNSIIIEDGKWTMIDSNGRLAFPAQFDYVAALKPGTGTALMMKNNKWGLTDTTGKERIAAQFDNLAYISQPGSKTLLAENKDPRFGYMDVSGKMIIPPGLKQAKSLGYGFIAFSDNNAWGIYNRQGTKIIDATYQEIRPFSGFYAAVKQKNRWGFIDTTGAEIIACTYEAVGEFSNGLARVRIKGKWGYISNTGNMVIEAVYAAAEDFKKQAAVVRQGPSLSLINASGNIITKAVFREINAIGSTGFFAARKEERYALMNNAGVTITAFKYEEIKSQGAGRLSYRVGARWGLMDTTGKEITRAVYERMLPFAENRSAVRTNALWGYMDTTGKMIIAPRFTSAQSFSESRALVYESVKRKGYIDSTGRMVFTIALSGRSGSFSEGKATSGARGSMIYINRQGIRLFRTVYSVANDFKDGVAVVCSKGRWGIISYSGQYIVEPKFGMLDNFENGLARFQLPAVYGIYNTDGKELLPVNNDVVQALDCGLYRIDQNNAVGYLDQKGIWRIALQE